jgi:hypothetical protein
MLSRRAFLQSTAAYGALAATGVLNARPAGAVATWVSPASIPNDGSANVSAALTDWLATTGQPGDTFKLRRGPGFAPGAYWIPQGVRISKPMTFDLAGCWMYTGVTLGEQDPDFEANRHNFPPLYGETFDVTDPNFQYLRWPRSRRHLIVAASNVHVMSSLANARIQGAARRAQLRSGRLFVPSGCQFYSHLEAQHAIELGEGLSAPCTDSTVDLTNIALEFPHGDGIALARGCQRIHIHGRRMGRTVVAGSARDPQDGDALGPHVGGSLGAGYDETTGLFSPVLEVYPGIHHIGRQGISLAFAMNDILIEEISMWRTGRTAYDFEPAENQLVERVTIRRTETGIHHLGWMTAAGGPTKDITIEQNISYEKMPVVAVQGAGEIRHRNWRVIENWGGLRTRTGQVCDFANVDGIRVRGNMHTIDADVDPVRHANCTNVVEASNTWPVSTTSIPLTDPPPGPWS